MMIPSWLSNLIRRQRYLYKYMFFGDSFDGGNGHTAGAEKQVEGQVDKLQRGIVTPAAPRSPAVSHNTQPAAALCIRHG